MANHRNNHKIPSIVMNTSIKSPVMIVMERTRKPTIRDKVFIIIVLKYRSMSTPRPYTSKSRCQYANSVCMWREIEKKLKFATKKLLVIAIMLRGDNIMYHHKKSSATLPLSKRGDAVEAGMKGFDKLSIKF